MLLSLEVRESIKHGENCKQFVLARGDNVPRLIDSRWVCQNVKQSHNPWSGLDD